MGAQKPWSNDRIFQTVRFCNVRREDDTVTRWLRRLWSYPGCEHNIAATIMARMVNKTESLEQISYPFGGFSADRFSNTMSLPGSWGSAYIVSTNGRAMPKHEYIAGLLEGLFEQLEGATLGPTLVAAHARLMAFDGLGSFMAAQIIADLKNTEGTPEYDAPDWNGFSAHGPGSLRGLSWYFGTKVTPGGYHAFIQEAWEDLPPGHRMLVLDHQNLQNCFCEYDKYMRVLTGTGRAKRGYAGV